MLSYASWTHCHIVTPMATLSWLSIGSGNGLVSDGTKPLPEPVLTYHQRYSMAFNIEQFYMNSIHKMCSEMTLLRWQPYLLGPVSYQTAANIPDWLARHWRSPFRGLTYIVIIEVNRNLGAKVLVQSTVCCQYDEVNFLQILPTYIP